MPSMTIPQLDSADVRRFWGHVDVLGQDKCWPWKIGRDNDGYGIFKACGRGRRAHRVAYSLHFHEDPGELLVCHSCDNPCCCNPSHLFLGTNKQNIRDCQDKGRLRPAHGQNHGSKTKPHLWPRGERVGGSRLTEANVLDIRERFAKGESQQSIADEYKVDRQTVGMITRGKNWKHVGGPTVISSSLRHGRRGINNPSAVLNEKVVRHVRESFASGRASVAQLAEQYGVTKGAIRHIITRHTWRHVS